ncbi:MAG: phage antirepressor protein [Cyanobacteria bacterium SIG28]|nr:phage antirepressor protein [Cyanobacteria bacterium SIG28]
MDNNKKTAIKLFEDYKVRTSWDNEKETWYFSVEDIVFVLTESADTKQYIKKMRKRDPELNSNWGTICTHVEMIAKDGKNRKVMASDTEGILRLIQSIPSPKAEPFKLWLAKVGSERLDEMQDPEIAINRALQYYLAKGYSPEWVNQRLKSIEVRKALTDEWQRSGVKSTEYGILTDILTQEWSGMKTREYKDFKGLKKESLRDNMSNMELVLNMLAEVSTTEISKQKNPQTMEENKSIAKQGGSVAKEARKNIELATGKSVITDENFLSSTKKPKQIKSKD